KPNRFSGWVIHYIQSHDLLSKITLNQRKTKNDYFYHLQLKTQKTKAHKQRLVVSLKKRNS
ncbi:hypothetical protein, partial [Helicobacter pylori]|uniref:hypothetical protein n=1 Tax=Helicobacter pylori TaxID=210 RepID=UPI0002BA6C40